MYSVHFTTSKVMLPKQFVKYSFMQLFYTFLQIIIIST